MSSIQPRKQRNALRSAPAHARAAGVRAHLAKELREQYRARTVIVNKGDTVEVLRGDAKGTRGRVLNVRRDDYRLEIEGVTNTRAGRGLRGGEVPRPVHPSNVVVVRLSPDNASRIARLKERTGGGAE